MPCSDVSENLHLRFDYEDRVTYYSLSKDTCSGAVGQPSLLRKWIRNRSARDILATSGEDLHAFFPTRSQTWQFLYAKHLFAVQRAIRALTGDLSGSPQESCSVESVSYGPEGIELRARIRIDLLTDEIRACKGCGCSS
jgi:hypothetical protein